MHPELAAPSNLGKFNNTLKLRNAQGKAAQADDVRVANEVRGSGKPTLLAWLVGASPSSSQPLAVSVLDGAA